jgi:hypothetical protein
MITNNGTEERIKLHILVSLARSQRALARILENVADTAEASGQAADDVADNLRAISQYQRILTAKITGMLPSSSKRRGIPGEPWLNRTNGVR